MLRRPAAGYNLYIISSVLVVSRLRQKRICGYTNIRTSDNLKGDNPNMSIAFELCDLVQIRCIYEVKVALPAFNNGQKTTAELEAVTGGRSASSGGNIRLTVRKYDDTTKEYIVLIASTEGITVQSIRLSRKIVADRHVNRLARQCGWTGGRLRLQRRALEGRCVLKFVNILATPLAVAVKDTTGGLYRDFYELDMPKVSRLRDGAPTPPAGDGSAKCYSCLRLKIGAVMGSTFLHDQATDGGEVCVHIGDGKGVVRFFCAKSETELTWAMIFFDHILQYIHSVPVSEKAFHLAVGYAREKLKGLIGNVPGSPAKIERASRFAPVPAEASSGTKRRTFSLDKGHPSKRARTYAV